MKSCRSHLINKLGQRIMDEDWDNSENNLVRIAMQCGLDNDKEYDDEVLDDPRRGQAEPLNRGIY